MSATELNMGSDSGQARTDARKATRRTAMILGVVAIAWYFGFMAMRLL
jgi:hypothetical protein